MYNNEDGLHSRLLGCSDQMHVIIRRMALAQVPESEDCGTVRKTWKAWEEVDGMHAES